MLEGQTNIFEMIYPTYKITKKIRTIELFAGYGSTKLGWNYLGIDVESWRICEWAVKSIQAYKDIHFTDDNFDYSKDLSIDEIKQYLFNKGISSNYNEPMTQQQVDRLNEKQARTIYNNIKATHNLVNIQQVKGKDLEIVDTDKYDYILTYSFPCQDISGAGLRKGFEDTSTRSGMLWEVERILTECKELGTLPSVLLMENVPLIHSIGDNMNSFQKWVNRLEELGYKNYWQDLIATDYGMPQTRNRTFMVSILGDYNYTFPKPIPLKLKLKDMLEDNVDEKYYLSDKMIEYIYSDDNSGKYQRKKARESCDKSIEKGIACTITTTAGNRPTDNFVKVKNATKKGYLEATTGDGIDVSSRMQHHRGTVQKDKIQTLTTKCDRGVIVNENYIQWKQKGHLDIDCRAYFEDKVAPTTTTTTPKGKILQNDLRIRKLTPRECFRLMGVKDEDFDKVAKNQSDSSLYHLAGDSIVVDVLCHLYKQLI